MDSIGYDEILKSPGDIGGNHCADEDVVLVVIGGKDFRILVEDVQEVASFLWDAVVLPGNSVCEDA